MSLHNSDTVPGTFQDVVACFSEEEWKLLHEWQKELYKNVMNEIQQALISLGPIIATSVFSLRTKEKNVSCSVDSQDSAGRNSGNDSPEYSIVNPDPLTRLDVREDVDVWDAHETEGGIDINESASYYPAVHPNILLRMQHEEEMDLRGWSSSEGSEINILPTQGFQPTRIGIRRKKPIESSGFSMSHPVANRRRKIIPSSRSEVISFVIKDEQDVYSVDEQNFENKDCTENKECIEVPTDSPVSASVFSLNSKAEDNLRFHKEAEPEVKLGDGIVSQNKKEENSVDYVRAGKRLKSASENAKGIIFPRNLEGSESSDGLKRELGTRRESDVSDASDLILNQKSLKVEISDDFMEGESYSNSAAFHTAPPKSQHFWHPITQRKQNAFHKRSALDHHRTASENIIYQCSECLKRFSGKTPYLKHQRTHHRSYQCIECGKSFSCKYHLIRHQTKHTGEKPYQCDVCEKCFTQKGSLTIHQRIHSGERPYQCTECEYSFREKKQLVGHYKKAHRQ